MNALFKCEVNRLFASKKTWIFIVVAFLITIGLSIHSTSGEVAFVNDSNGNRIELIGIEAIKYSNKIEAPLTGEVAEDKLITSLNVYRHFYNSVDDKFSYTKEFNRNIPIMALIQDISIDSDFKNYDIQELPDVIGKNYYKVREGVQEHLFKDELNNDQKLIDYAKRLDKNVKKPFYFSPNEGWQSTMEYISILYYILCLMIIVFLSSVYSDDYYSGADVVMRTTKHGIKELAKVKFITSLVFVLAIFILCTCIYLGMASFKLPLDGLKASSQFINSLVPVSLTVGGALKFIVLFGLLSSMCTAAFTMLISSGCRYPILSLILSVALLGIYFLGSYFENSGSIIPPALFNMFPFKGAGIYFTLFTSIDIYSLFGIPVWAPYIIFVSSIALFIIFYHGTIKRYVNMKF